MTAVFPPKLNIFVAPDPAESDIEHPEQTGANAEGHFKTETTGVFANRLICQYISYFCKFII